MADASGWLPFVTLALGYGIKTLEDWIQHRRTMAKEREARASMRHDQRIASRIAFQRDTLLQLQDAVQKLARAAGRTHHLDEMAFRETKVWRKERLPEELNQGYLVAQTQTSMLSSRVRDDRVRELVAQLKTASTDVVLARDDRASHHGLQRIISLSEELHGRIGELIRTIDDDES
jgi:hypothetical protein